MPIIHLPWNSMMNLQHDSITIATEQESLSGTTVFEQSPITIATEQESPFSCKIKKKS